MIADGTLEYIYTAGVLISFIGLIIGTILNRKQIALVLHNSGFSRRGLLLALVPVILFVAIVILYVRPTQLLFFDDAIYQIMALDLLHTGQAWMCNYGTPTACISGQIFHEPVGLSFNIAIGFLILGLHRSSAYAVQVSLAALSVFMTFMVALLLFKDRRAALFSALALAVMPIILAWSAATNSDMATLAYSLICIFMLLILIRKRSILALSNFLLSLSLLLYMKVDALIYIPMVVVLYLLLYEKGIVKGITETLKIGAKNILNTRLLLLILLFVLLVYPTILFALSNAASDGYGYQGSNVQNTCAINGPFITAKSAINLQNFNVNVCSNLLFWANAYKSQQVVQPIYLTVLAIIGAFLLFVFRKPKVLAALLVWFGAIFLLYTAFYAGSVTFGVDWRFMISLTAPFAMLCGFSISGISRSAESLFSNLAKGRFPKYAGFAVAAILAIGMFYVLYLNSQYVFLNPSSIQQAGDARFYENFIYNSSSLIPADCMVYSYDPELFNINDRAAAQLSDLYNTTFYQEANARFPCSVIDIGYWCNTPGNICTQAESSSYYNTTPIATATYKNGFTYGLYRVTSSHG